MYTAHLIFWATIVVLAAVAGLGFGYLLCRIYEGPRPGANQERCRM